MARTERSPGSGLSSRAFPGRIPVAWCATVMQLPVTVAGPRRRYTGLPSVPVRKRTTIVMAKLWWTADHGKVGRRPRANSGSSPHRSEPHTPVMSPKRGLGSPAAAVLRPQRARKTYGGRASEPQTRAAGHHRRVRHEPRRARSTPNISRKIAAPSPRSARSPSRPPSPGATSPARRCCRTAAPPARRRPAVPASGRSSSGRSRCQRA